MSTNYYAHTNACICCGRSDNSIHIGKSAAGWRFALRLHPEADLNSLEDWLRLLMQTETTIFDEYHNRLTMVEFLGIVFRQRTATIPEANAVVDHKAIAVFDTFTTFEHEFS